MSPEFNSPDIYFLISLNQIQRTIWRRRNLSRVISSFQRKLLPFINYQLAIISLSPLHMYFQWRWYVLIVDTLSQLFVLTCSPYAFLMVLAFSNRGQFHAAFGFHLQFHQVIVIFTDYTCCTFKLIIELWS